MVLRKSRKIANLTQKELAKRINVSQCHYSSIECGRSEPSLKTFSKIATVLDIDMNILKNADFNKS